MRIFIAGGSGQLGLDLTDRCQAAGDEVVSASSADLDLRRRDLVLGAVTSFRPEVIVNCATWTAVDACEADPERAFAVNGLGVRWLAEGADRVGAHLVQMSTDYVFDGTLDRPYREWDRPNPLSAYGASKLAGEQEAEVASSHAVVRTSWLCGARGSNTLKTVLGLRDRDELAFVDDQRGRPTFTDDLARAVRELAVGRMTGRYHLTNQGAVSWYEFVRDILDVAGADPGIVRPITTSELDPPRPAPRPANSVLDDLAWRAAGMEPLPHYSESLRRVVGQLLG